MKYCPIVVDESRYVEQFGLPKLAAKAACLAGLTAQQVKELCECGTMTLSRADCVKQACKRILAARDRHEKVFVGGDYDADGICATAIMKKTLTILGIENGYYIPDRLKEGYGLSVKTVHKAKEKGYSLIITVDNGVKAQEAIEAAHTLHMDVIVSDHHIIDSEVPADILVHPSFMEDDYSTLCGAGTALQISRALIGDDPQLTAIAACASIGDVMPLWKETRRIVTAGLEIMNHGMPLSLLQLVDQPYIDVQAIAFQIVPKLNAVSRMDDDSNVNTLIPYLLSEDPVLITNYAHELEQVNRKRKNLSARLVRKAEKLIDDSDFALLYDEAFESGINGLVAGKVASKYHRPVLVMADNGDLLTGSARSVPGFDIHAFFSDFKHLAGFGGHAMAAGISIKKEDLPAFREEIKEKMAAMDFVYQEPEVPVIACSTSDLTTDEIMGLQILEPYPKELLQPLFSIRDFHDIEVKRYRSVTRYTFQTGYGECYAVKFGGGADLPDVPKEIIGRLDLNRFRDRITPQVVIEEIH